MPDTLVEPAADVIAELFSPPALQVSDGQTRLTIHRTSEQDVKERQVIFSLDGERIAELLHGQTFTCAIAPGTRSGLAVRAAMRREAIAA